MEKRKCAGPIRFGDQGIEQCYAAGCDGGCLCCDLTGVDHTEAEYECFKHSTGRCVLLVHAGRPCQTPTPKETTCQSK